MNISPSVLADEVARARHNWPFIDSINDAHGLPVGLLLAVGSRETNLTDEIGDGGHGHGVWQLDDRSHVIPNPYPVEQQAEDAAAHLVGTHQACGTWQGACAAYNSGQCNDAHTTGGDYGADCISRQAWIAANTEEVIILSDADKAWLQAAVTTAVNNNTNSIYNLIVNRPDADVDLRKLRADLDAIKAHLGVA